MKKLIGIWLFTFGIFFITSCILYLLSGGDEWVSRVSIGLMCLGFWYVGGGHDSGDSVL